ncbi:CAZyme family AA7 [Aspergillus niger]|nr:CAZyme family AA7 [Aspergillus niger]KAI2861306.1 CAZyme family AA7 [Aspergillus niger]KAI2871363.1 CAZyme family AA7 [Aspergillus niger]
MRLEAQRQEQGDKLREQKPTDQSCIDAPLSKLSPEGQGSQFPGTPSTDLDPDTPADDQKGDPSYKEQRRFPRVSDEDLVNLYLLALASVVTLSVEGVNAHWSPERKGFKVCDENGEKLYEARIDGHLFLSNSRETKVIVEVKPVMQDESPRVMMQETAQMAAWIHADRDVIQEDTRVEQRSRIGLQIIFNNESVWTLGDSVYEEARVGRVFNHRRPQRFPLAVVKATSTSDIIKAVKLAAEKKCRVAIRSGGHSWAAWSVRDESILIDLGNYKHLEVDAENRIAKATPSMTGKELNGTLIKEYGLMFPGGHCPDVGLGGFLLQGGMGWNCRNWGWACERVQAVDVVTATGELLHCNATQNRELYWAARGAGPGFPGVVTQYHLELIPYPKDGFRSSGYVYPIRQYRQVFDWLLSITPGFDEDTEIAAVAAYPEGIDEHCFFVLFVAMKSTPEEAEKALLPAQITRPAGAIQEWFCQVDSLENQYSKQAKANPERHRYCAENAYIRNDADVPTVLEEAFTTLPHKKAFALWYAMYPCSRRKLPDMALSMQSDHYFALYTVWEEEKDDDRCQAWVADVMKRVQRHGVGSYLGDADFQVRKTRYWADDNARRLMDIRRKWDPQGRICGYLDQGDQSGTRGLDNAKEIKL